ncbi:hypothetical protein GCM10010525_15370 [Glutamicibacter bergerei]|uniref:Uncharacterized protein n=1 Tax=Glutamicibacter ardleyensis TaxID=225894 RepID=A0ABQ2DNP6_9MICC|nr:hypothetical protein GCM10007173_25570 [Glutamicibacter ardleyensis]
MLRAEVTASLASDSRIGQVPKPIAGIKKSPGNLKDEISALIGLNLSSPANFWRHTEK